MRTRKYDYEAIVKAYTELKNAREVEATLGVPVVIVRRAVRLAEGKCAKCETRVKSGETFCKLHKESHYEQSTNRRKERRRLGLCLHCDKPYELPSRSLCQKHRLEWNEKVKLKGRQKRKDDPTGARQVQKIRVIRSNYGENGVSCFTDADGKCKICKRQQGDVDIHIHHINCNEYDHEYGNLVCLCRPCHLAVHSILRSVNPRELIEWLTFTYDDLIHSNSGRIDPSNYNI